MGFLNRYKKYLLLSCFSLFPVQSSFADVISAECNGVCDAFLGLANQYLHQLEDKANQAVDKYVSMANFNLGSADFGLQGNADIGQLKTPDYDCKNPKNPLASGMADFGLSPSYLINAVLFGKPLNIVDVSMGGGQGPKALVA